MRLLLTVIRPKTLPLAFSVMLASNVLAAYDGAFRWSVFVLSVLTALGLQILSNLANDYGDGVRGTDDHRQGPMRLTANGLIEREQVLIWIGLCAVLTMTLGLWLLSLSFDTQTEIYRFMVLGLMCLVAALKYTLGRCAYGYHALGEVAVFIFFGLVAVMGGYYLQTKQLQASVVLPAIGSGLLCAAVLNVNNIRDIVSDRQAGKVTVAVRLGYERSRLFQLLLIGAGLVAYMVFALLETWWSALWLLLLPLVYRHLKTVLTSNRASIIGCELPRIVLLVLAVNGLFAVGLLLALNLA